MVNVELIDYTHDGINKIARLARATRKNKLEDFVVSLDYVETMVQGNGYTDEQRKSVKDVRDNRNNEKFVKSLIKVKHYGVLEHINFTFHVSGISRCLTHQLVRHRIGFSFLQMSNRHAKPICSDYVIPNSIHDDDDLFSEYTFMMKDAYNNYERLIKYGVPVEDARYVLPPAFFTHISITCNARALRHFLELRLHKSAQLEIRELACKVFDIVYDLYPVIFEDLKDLRDKNEDI
jgi:thymidylate synthase (FAD)